MKKRLFAVLTAVITLFLSALITCITALSAPVPVFASAPAGMKIVLDAGHGGIDGGVTGVKTGVKESELNLKITFAMKHALEEVGFDVTLTRKTSAGLYGIPTKGFKRRDMQARKDVIQQARPDLVVSIHQNRYPTQTTRGAQVFFNTNVEGSRLLAQSLQASLNELYKTQGVKPRAPMQGEFFILDCAPVPSVIVECGFLSNPNDEALLCSEDWQNRLAHSLIIGLMHYFSPSSL